MYISENKLQADINMWSFPKMHTVIYLRYSVEIFELSFEIFEISINITHSSNTLGSWTDSCMEKLQVW